jgi:hypothetical protein
MNCYTDNFFSIGKSHLVCQDYAWSSPDGDYTSLSDGCSSAGRTEIGAMLIATSKESKQVLDCAKILNLKNEDLYATKIEIVYNKFSNSLSYGIFGDGCILECFENHYEILDNSFSLNAPFYPAYEWLNLQEFYNKDFGNQLVTTTVTKLDKNFNLLEERKEDYYFSDYIVHSNIDAKYILGFSDGIHSFVDENGIPISYIEILKNLTAFKGPINSTSLSRRWRMFQREFKTKGWSHYDDVSGIMVCLVEQ